MWRRRERLKDRYFRNASESAQLQVDLELLKSVLNLGVKVVGGLSLRGFRHSLESASKRLVSRLQVSGTRLRDGNACPDTL